MPIILMLLLTMVAPNLYAQGEPEPQPVYQVEGEAWDYFPDQLANANNHNLFIFNPQAHLWAVYDKQGELVGAGRASGGKAYCQDIQAECRTVEGEFTVQRKGDKECISNTFPIQTNGGAPMPYCMFFHKGYAIHGSNNVPENNASHGCIRIATAAAAWMNQYYLDIGDRVIVLPYQHTT